MSTKKSKISSYVTRVYSFEYQDDTSILKSWCQVSRSLYNRAMDLIIQDPALYRTTLYHKLSHSIEYRAFPKAQAAQQILALALSTYKGYIKALASYNKNPTNFTGRPELPKTDSDDQQVVMIPDQSCRIKKNFLVLTKKFSIKIPQVFNRKFQQVRIKHLSGNRYQIGIVYYLEKRT